MAFITMSWKTRKFWNLQLWPRALLPIQSAKVYSGEYGQQLDCSRVRDIEEISGSGVMAVVDGHQVAAGNDKRLDRLNVPDINCHCVGTIVHMAIDGKYAGHIVITDIIKPNAKTGH